MRIGISQSNHVFVTEGVLIASFIKQALGMTAICIVDESVNRTRVGPFWNGWVLRGIPLEINILSIDGISPN